MEGRERLDVAAMAGAEAASLVDSARPSRAEPRAQARRLRGERERAARAHPSPSRRGLCAVRERADVRGGDGAVRRAVLADLVRASGMLGGSPCAAGRLTGSPPQRLHLAAARRARPAGGQPVQQPERAVLRLRAAGRGDGASLAGRSPELAEGVRLPAHPHSAAERGGGPRERAGGGAQGAHPCRPAPPFRNQPAPSSAPPALLPARIPLLSLPHARKTLTNTNKHHIHPRPRRARRAPRTPPPPSGTGTSSASASCAPSPPPWTPTCSSSSAAAPWRRHFSTSTPPLSPPSPQTPPPSRTRLCAPRWATSSAPSPCGASAPPQQQPWALCLTLLLPKLRPVGHLLHRPPPPAQQARAPAGAPSL